MISANEVWMDRLKTVVEKGRPVITRGSFVTELIGRGCSILMRSPAVTIKSRRLNYPFMFAETACILTGDNKVSTISPYLNKIARYSDNGDTFYGHYGPPFVEQIPYIDYAFEKDPMTRQAVLTLWRQSPPDSKDIPCTVAMQFLLRNGYFNTVVFMRSSDVYVGFAYDIFVFSMMSFFILLHLKKNTPAIFSDVSLGFLNLSFGSQHLYEVNKEDAARVINAYDTGGAAAMTHYSQLRPREFEDPNDLVQWLWSMANKEPSKKLFLDNIYNP